MGATDSIQTVARTRQVTAAQVRALSGFNAARDVADGDIEAAIDTAQATVIGEVAARAESLPLVGSRDGSNTRFMVHPDRTARVILDADLSLATDASDVDVWLYEAPDSSGVPTYTEATVASVDAIHGIVTLSSAPARTIDAVLLTARMVSARFDLDRVQNAIKYLAAHTVFQAAVRHGKVNLAGGAKAGEERPRVAPKPQWLAMYESEIRRLRGGRPGAAKRDVSLRASDAIVEGWRHAP